MTVASVKDEELDPLFQEKLRELKTSRDKAADDDEYDRAKVIRETEERIREYGVKVI